jgi:LEA14-like dessication related protein
MTLSRLALPTLVLPVLLLLVSCASIIPDIDPPRVTVESFKALPGSDTTPRFEIKLRIANPNTQALDIAGISYGIELMGNEVVSGVTNEVPRIEGYTEEVVTIESGLKLFQLLKLLAGMGHNPTDTLDYRLTAKIDFSGLVPTQRIEESGSITLR